MAQKLHFSIILISLFILSSISQSFSTKPNNNAIDLWCSRTPYPDVCKHFFNGQFDLKKLSEFKKTALKIAMERAIIAETLTKELGQKCRNQKERAAWADCLELYQTTILHLNKTFSEQNCSDFDIQTWLSSALTNLDTCRAGFVDLGVKDYGVVFPFLANNNVTKLISNSLAMNNCSESDVGYKNNEGFPKWLRVGDRRLLQAAEPKADLVVAQDGSGNYKTVQAAVDAAAKRKGSGRFVIHIKRGVYKENVVIKVKNLMLVGDGLRYTIISGSRSVGGGSTTFNSATVGEFF